MTAIPAPTTATDAHSGPSYERDEPASSAYERTRSRAEALLALALDAIGVNEHTPCAHLRDESVPIVATAGAGYAQLATIDFATEQANAQARLFGSILDEFRAIAATAQPVPTVIAVDGGGDVWERKVNGDFGCITSSFADRPLEAIHRDFPPVREFIDQPSTVARITAPEVESL